jgi:glycosyltransferase involved in cell wall biosynthesis
MSTVSLCIIVRNEEKVLEKCLSSIVDIADEIIIVDTGSTDRTVEIAKKFVDKVHHFHWIDDFAAARNYAESIVTCKYIFRFDADCTLQNGDMAKLLDLKKKNFDGADLVKFNFIEHFETLDNGKIKPLFEESTVYLHKNKKFRWQAPIHEFLVLINSKLQPKIYSDSSILILHHREEANKPWRTKQNLDILKKSVSIKDQNYTRMLRFYARDLYFDGQYKESVKQFQKLLECKIESEVKAYAIDKIYFALFYSNRHDRIPEFEYLIDNPKNPVLILLAADVACLSDPIKAKQAYLQYIQNPFVKSQFEFDIERFNVHPYIQLGKILIHQKNFDEAKKYLNIAISEKPNKDNVSRINALLEFCY